MENEPDLLKAYCVQVWMRFFHWADLLFWLVFRADNYQIEYNFHGLLFIIGVLFRGRAITNLDLLTGLQQDHPSLLGQILIKEGYYSDTLEEAIAILREAKTTLSTSKDIGLVGKVWCAVMVWCSPEAKVVV